MIAEGCRVHRAVSLTVPKLVPSAAGRLTQAEFFSEICFAELLAWLTWSFWLGGLVGAGRATDLTALLPAGGIVWILRRIGVVAHE